MMLSAAGSIEPQIVKFIPQPAMKVESVEACTLSLTSALDGSGWLMPGPCSFSRGTDLVPSI